MRFAPVSLSKGATGRGYLPCLHRNPPRTPRVNRVPHTCTWARLSPLSAFLPLSRPTLPMATLPVHASPRRHRFFLAFADKILLTALGVLHFVLRYLTKGFQGKAPPVCGATHSSEWSHLWCGLEQAPDTGSSGPGCPPVMSRAGQLGVCPGWTQMQPLYMHTLKTSKGQMLHLCLQI